MTKKTFVPKENQDLPDYYTVKISYVTGKEETIEVAHHRLIEKLVLKEIKDNNGNTIDYQTAPHPAPFFEFWTKDDICITATLSNIVGIHFDKNWTKAVRIYNENKKK